MKAKIDVFCLFLMTIPYGSAQLFSTPFDRPAGSTWAVVTAQNFAFDRGPLNRPSGESVSSVRLGHKVPRRARSAFARGLTDAGKGLWPRAAAEFEETLMLDPEFSEASGNLGVTYYHLGRFEDAAAALRRAIQLDSATSTHHSNLAYVLTRLGRRSEAEREAQTAVDLDAANCRGQLMLGFLLASRPETRRQAALHLAEAAREFPEAHEVLSDMYLAEGDSRTAARELERYQETISNRRSHEEFGRH
jgi:tetratricopeptide (TPR) repeat protein